MSLRVKVGLQIVTMLLGALLISAAAVWSINGVEQDYDVALAGYDELREVYGSVGSNVLVAQELLITSPADRDRAVRHLQNARDRFELFQASFRGIPRLSPRDMRSEEAIHDALLTALTRVESTRPDDPDDQEAEIEAVQAVETAMSQTGMFASHVGQAIRTRSELAAQKR